MDEHLKNEVNIESANKEILAYKLNEIDKAALMDLLKRVAQKCFIQCVQKVDKPKLLEEEKICLNTCFNSRITVREKLLDIIYNEIKEM